MSQSNGYVLLNRERSALHPLRAFSVSIDDRSIDKIKAGQTKKYAVSPGKHIMRVSLDLYKSRPLTVTVGTGETVNLLCGDVRKDDNSDRVWKTLEHSLKSITAPSDYLFLEVRSTSNTGSSQAPLHGTQDRQQSRRSPLIFLSYRREDSGPTTARICDHLQNHFGDDAIFRDVDSISLGTDFRERIRETIEKANVLIVIIGKRWLSIEKDGVRRLEQEDDPVRFEIEAAMARKLTIMPVYVNDAPQLAPRDLPANLASLAFNNSLSIRDDRLFRDAIEHLIKDIEKLDAESPAATKQFCVSCGNPLAPGHRFCTKCGRPAPQNRV